MCGRENVFEMFSRENGDDSRLSTDFQRLPKGATTWLRLFAAKIEGETV